jgi:hypothetical protein
MGLGLGQADNTIHCTWSAVCTPMCIQLPFWQRQLPPAEVPPELKINENSKRARVFVVDVKMVFIPETKTFPARQLCLLCGCKNDENAVAGPSWQSCQAWQSCHSCHSHLIKYLAKFSSGIETKGFIKHIFFHKTSFAKLRSCLAS